MPLPLPNLDTRRWQDLVEEGRALIPRYAPQWTDHNLHDPGITLMELFAYLVEQDIFRVNQIPARHRRKFLALIGFAPLPPQPARTMLALRLQPGETGQSLPEGIVFAAGTLRFCTTTSVHVVPASIRRVHVHDGAQNIDQTRLWRDRLPFPLFGVDPQPEQHPALYLGLDAPLPAGETVMLGLWFDSVQGDYTAADEQKYLRALHRRQQEACQPHHPEWRCEDAEADASDADAAESTPKPALLHHSVRVAWQYYDGTDWRTLNPEAGEIQDETCGLLFDGRVLLTLPGPMAEVAIADAPPMPTLRCRLIAGPPDATPVLAHVALNTVPVEQALPARAALVINPGVTPAPGEEPQPGSVQALRLELDNFQRIDAFNAGQVLPEALVLAYTPASADEPGELVLELVPVGRGNGAPSQSLALRDGPVADGEAQVWSLEADPDDGLLAWTIRPDLDASGRNDRHYVLDAAAGMLHFGDGARGRVPPVGVPLLARYKRTVGAAGNLRAGTAWTLAGADDLRNRALLGEDVADVAARLAPAENPAQARGGTDQETLNHAAGRAAESLWAHERLVELVGDNGRTLDQLGRARVLGRSAPQRAVSLLDFERLALATPGARIARARAWAGIDPAYPCLNAPGTVTVVLVPYLPVGRPYPTDGLLQMVRTFLDTYRVIGTRLVVAAPDYVSVRVRASVRSRPGADAQRVQQNIVDALNSFFDPLTGGPDGHGWPFGRDVYRAEVLQTIDNVPGVDHVLALELLAGNDEGDCGNLCVGPMALIAAGQHQIEIR